MYKIKENIDIIKAAIYETHKNSNFSALPVPKLIAVSKKQNEEKVIEALEAGQTYFGENRVQEAQQRWASKIQQYKNLQIRLIGPLQTNKVKDALNLFDIIETIDREKLAKEIAKKNNDRILLCEDLKRIIRFDLEKADMIDLIYDEIVDLKKYAYDDYEDAYQKFLNLRHEHLVYSERKRKEYKNIDKSYDSIPDSLNIVNRMIKLEKSLKSKKLSFVRGRLQQYIGTLQTFYRSNKEQSDIYYKKAINSYKTFDNYYNKSFLFGVRINLSANQFRRKNYKVSIDSINEIFNKHHHKIPGFKIHEKEVVYRILASSYFYLKEDRLAYQKLSLAYIERKENYLRRRNLIFAIISKRYKEEENLKTITLKRIENNLLYFISAIILLIGYFIIQNSNKKRLLALQEKELETQKNLTLIKEQEITTINAIVEGQEKERKRVAEDLHDNLGSVIATLKLHFDNLRINREKKKIDQETLFDKTESLIDEAYKKVRSIAHAKNAGVIANQGLLIAVELMAEKISSANTTQIQVVHSGLDKPLDNSLEISLFRIVQELTTNIIKHAKASHATIGLNQHENGINIMIEDDGKGMDITQIDLNKGMGLHSIQTRVEHLQGDFTIDSTPTKGTTIIINVPT